MEVLTENYCALAVQRLNKLVVTDSLSHPSFYPAFFSGIIGIYESLKLSDRKLIKLGLKNDLEIQFFSNSKIVCSLLTKREREKQKTYRLAFTKDGKTG